MDELHLDLVRWALTRHLSIEPDSISLESHLADDWGLDAFDLILVAMRIEDTAGGEFPMAELERVRTVADLGELVRVWLDETASVRVRWGVPGPHASPVRGGL